MTCDALLDPRLARGPAGRGHTLATLQERDHMKKLTPGRVATLLTAASGITGAVAVPVANLDITSTAGVVMGVFAIFGAFNTWMKGWREHEARQAS